ncbi:MULTISPECIES: tartrate dehydrogenase [Mammaliicoccus]|jgi:tartrate dehydrogenase/decarboxylase/D-malate dehydrogenase|uniref:tartrate dehydrogenase n=1 Tax=Mammaliicoccus TaxID=2803850 RepID=UPI00085CB84D|nr:MULTISPECIES: tartrate dehydrogenase [Mammaliicoccus]MBW0761065.1 tartrate dehydrogenase [Mammaliicoccus lentus]MDQ7142407.1 tartrate dehydrogenase [Mammaliicoccus lentus]WGZ43626.1 tartrate dehydrogenase [Mammaliicoccus lentus]SCU41920.1 3-isopropylmalate dehydrogenase [Mammaliicoccus lentus]
MNTKNTFKIAVIPGDGIGKEVINEGIRVLNHLSEQSNGKFSFEYDYFPWGCEYYLEHEKMMAEDGLEQIKNHDAIYFGAVGFPNVPDHISLWGLRIAICQGFDQWANIRPVEFLPGVKSKLNHPNVESLNWVLIRENSEGEYSGIGGRNFTGRGPGNEVAVQSSLFTEKGCERIIRFAFETAKKRKRKKVTSVTKSNAQQYGMVLWDEVFERVSKEYPDVETDQWLVDAMAANFVLHPEDLEVVVASNLLADILSDLGSALAGSLGIAASANLNPDGRYPSMFESVHGSAPDIAGQGIANPIGAIGSAALMLDNFGLKDEAMQLNNAIKKATDSGALTQDIGGDTTTEEMTNAIIQNLNSKIVK